MFPVEWDVLDGTEMDPYEAKLNHYTRMSKQPYHPFPDRFAYPKQHPVISCDKIWWDAYLELRCTEAGLPFRRSWKLGNTIKQAFRVGGCGRVERVWSAGGVSVPFHGL